MSLYKNDEYEVLYAFEGKGLMEYSYIMREIATGKLALLQDCAILDMETFTEEDFEFCDECVGDYTK